MEARGPHWGGSQGTSLEWKLGDLTGMEARGPHRSGSQKTSLKWKLEDLTEVEARGPQWSGSQRTSLEWKLEDLTEVEARGHHWSESQRTSCSGQHLEGIGVGGGVGGQITALHDLHGRKMIHPYALFFLFFTRLGRRHAIKKENGKKDRNKLLICFIFQCDP